MKKTPIFQQIVEWLRTRIESREFLPGGELPSESDLCRRFASSRSSVRKALELLEREQIIFRKPGIGSFVRDVNAAEAGALLNIGISNTTYVDWYTADIFAGASAACSRLHAQLVYVDINEYLSTRRIPLDGLIVLAGEEKIRMSALAQIPSEGIPVAMLNRFTDLNGISYFSVDYEREAEKAVDFMMTQGVTRRIGAIYAVHDSAYALRTRLRGFENGCRRRGLQPVVCPVPDLLAGTEVIREFLAAHPCEGLFLATCRVVNPVLEALRGWQSEKPMLLCFDKLTPEVAIRSEVASIEMPLREIAFAAVSHLVERRRDPAVAVARQLYDSRFVLNSGCFNRHLDPAGAYGRNAE